MVGSKKLDQDLYRDNIDFWDRAWSPVKAPYKEMPDLPYINAVPVRLKAAGATSVLDLGCGSGWLSVYLARAGFQVTGVDVAAHAIDLAKDWAAQEKLTAKFTVADITSMEFPPQSFDACVANSIFEHLTLELAVECLDKVHKLLKPMGSFFGCFDKVGTGPGEYFKLDDGSQIYTDKGRRGMLLRCFSDEELKGLFKDWKLESVETVESGSRIIWASARA